MKIRAFLLFLCLAALLAIVVAVPKQTDAFDLLALFLGPIVIWAVYRHKGGKDGKKN